MKYELINYCENDKYAKKAYSLIHNEPESKNLGDITLVNEKEIDDFNWMVGGSPCQDFSVAGKGKGAVWTCMNCKDDEGNNYQYNPLEVHYTKRDKCPKCNSTNIEKTRSSLVVEWLRILFEKKPNVAIYENVKNLVGKKHKHFFDLFINELHEYGYNTYYKVLNAKDYGVPQNRERVYLIIIKKELDNGNFKFPKGFDNGIRLKDVLEKEVDEKYYISQEKTEKLIRELELKGKLNKDAEPSIVQKCGDRGTNNYSVKEISNTIPANPMSDRGQLLLEPKIICVGNIYPSGGQNGNIYSTDGIAPTLRSGQGIVGNGIGSNNAPKILEENKVIAPTQTTMCNRSCSSATVLIKDVYYRIRKLTPLECFRLMGFSDEDFYILKENGISDSQCYKMAGNSIVVDVLYYIYLELYKAMPYLFEDIKLGSFFSGIGAFEKAIVRLQETIHNQINKGI